MTSPAPVVAHTSARVRGLDGLRAIAALLVVLYHTLPEIVPVGFVGVDIFFVLSGFLITMLLVREWATTSAIRIGRFWQRRIRRLFPAVCVATLGAVAMARLVGGDAFAHLKWQTLGALTASYNWLEIANGSEYFERNSPLLLTHMWTLAVEQQFYLVWPLIVWVALKIRPRSAWIVAVMLGVASFLENAVMVGLGVDITRTYVGTDTHIFSMMAGATLALLTERATRPPALDTHRWTTALRPWWGPLSLLSFFAIAVMAVAVHSETFCHPWAMGIAAICAAIAIRGILPDVATEGTLGRHVADALEVRPMVWLGERSYGIYLWHWPLYVLFGIVLTPVVAAVTILAGSIVLAHLSYTFIECPIRYRGWKTSAIGVWEWVRVNFPLPSLVPTVAVAVAFSIAVWGVTTSPSHTDAEEYVIAGQKALEQYNTTHETPTPGPAQTSAPAAPAAPSEPAKPGEAEKPVPAPAAPTPAAPAPAAPAPAPAKGEPISGSEITIMGDSIVLAATPALLKEFPGVVIDGKISRSSRHAVEVISALKRQGKLRTYVVVALATNAIFRAHEIESVLEEIGPERKLILVTGFGPRSDSWIPISNANILDEAGKHPDQIRVADWHAMIAGHTDLLARDLTHPGAEGAKIYAQAIKAALETFGPVTK